MRHHKKIILSVIIAALLLSMPGAEVLKWRAYAGQKYDEKVTIKESVTDLDSVTEKPASTKDLSPLQEVAAKNRSTIPYLHGIPTFPRGAVLPGDTWKNPASLTLDLSAFGIDQPVTIHFEVQYRLVEIKEIDSRSYYRIQAKWYPLWIPDAKAAKVSGIERIAGYSSMDLLWDNRAGSPKQSTVNEETQYRFGEKSSLLYTRNTKEDFTTVTDIVRDRMIKDLNRQIASQKVSNVEIKETEEGVVLSIENIQFEAESSVLSDAEKAKLTGIGKLLSAVANRKLSVVGHAANTAGSDEKDLLRLSGERAQAVADFLVQSGFRGADTIVASGLGGTKPLAANDTPEGRSKNRRVEIVIMDEEAE
jgi:flagellar motor protein MotB